MGEEVKNVYHYISFSLVLKCTKENFELFSYFFPFPTICQDQTKCSRSYFLSINTDWLEFFIPFIFPSLF